jgi:hypothetical protein
MHQVLLFVDGIHFGIAIRCADGWYKFEYAAGGASGVSSGSGSRSSGKTSNAVTVKRTPPTGEVETLGTTNVGLAQIIEFARNGSGFHNSDYGLANHNCRHFSHDLAAMMGLEEQYMKFVRDNRYLCAGRSNVDLQS